MKNRLTTILAVAAVLALALPLLFLKGCGSTWDGSDRANLTIRLGSAADGDDAVLLPPGVRFIEVAVTAPDMTPVYRVLDTGGVGPVSVSLNVPRGADRNFLVTAKDLRDETGTAIWNGSASADIGADPVHVEVQMGFVLSSDVLPPGVPAGLSASSALPGALSISWLPTTDNYLVAGYYIYTLIGGQHYLIGSTTGNTHSENGLMAGEYCFSVSAIDAAGNESGLATEQCVTVAGQTDDLPPGAPGSLSAFANSPASILLSWIAPADGDPPVGYYIYNSGGAGRFVGASTGTALTDTRLGGGTYCYNATSVNGWGYESGPAGPVCATVTGILFGPAGDSEEPSAPAALLANTVSMTGIGLTWTTAIDNTAVAGYNVYEDSGAGYEYRTSSIANAMSMERLAPGYYCYEVSAVDTTGNESAMSAESCVLVGGNAEEPRNPNCPEFLTWITNPGGNYKWHPDSNPPKCYGEREAPRTWWKKQAN